MICKSCKTENPEEAVYCKNCGKKLLEADDSVQGVSSNETAQSAPAGEKPANWKKWVGLAGGISAMCAVFVVLLCTFFVGVDLRISAEYMDTTTATYRKIWYYFGDLWKILPKTSYSNDMMKAADYMQAIYGLIVSVGMIVSTLVLSILAAVRFGMKTAGKSDKDYLKYAIGAVTSFICGTALLVAIDAMSSEGMYMTNESIVPNAAGIAGLVCGIVLLCGSLGCRIAINNRIVDKKTATKISFTVSSLVLLSIAVAFAAKPAAGEDDSFVNFFYWALWGDYEKLVSPVFALFAMTAQIAIVILAMAAIGSALRNLTADEPKNGLKFPIWFAVVSALFLIFSIVALKTSEESDINYVNIIVEFVFAVGYLVCAIVCKAVCKDKKETK
ncbi:MAG: hypothetical protein K2K12_03870 [Clostridia bacterium]|nr:hypothetical protein [Clostridia bacterium]